MGNAASRRLVLVNHEAREWRGHPVTPPAPG